jgi:hypothetical protein
MVHDGWQVYNLFLQAEHQTCLNHLHRRCEQVRLIL